MDGIGHYIKIETIEPDSREMREASSLMRGIDPDDSQFVALSIRLDAPIWSHDSHFKQQKGVKVVTSADILQQSAELPSLWQALHDEAQ